MTEVTASPRLSYWARRVEFSRLLTSRSEWFATAANNQEPAMNTYFDDIATAMVVITYGIATLSAVVAAFGGAI